MVVKVMNRTRLEHENVDSEGTLPKIAYEGEMKGEEVE